MGPRAASSLLPPPLWDLMAVQLSTDIDLAGLPGLSMVARDVCSLQHAVHFAQTDLALARQRLFAESLTLVALLHIPFETLPFGSHIQQRVSQAYPTVPSLQQLRGNEEQEFPLVLSGTELAVLRASFADLVWPVQGSTVQQAYRMVHFGLCTEKCETFPKRCLYMAKHDVGSAGPTFNVVFREFLGLRADERSAEESALLESMQPVVTSHNGTPSTSYTWFDVRAKFGQNSNIDQLQAWWTRHRTRLNRCSNNASTPSRLLACRLRDKRLTAYLLFIYLTGASLRTPPALVKGLDWLGGGFKAEMFAYGAAVEVFAGPEFCVE